MGFDPFIKGTIFKERQDHISTHEIQKMLGHNADGHVDLIYTYVGEKMHLKGLELRMELPFGMF